jgi:regulator of vacuolar morphogenesis
VSAQDEAETLGKLAMASRNAASAGAAARAAAPVEAPTPERAALLGSVASGPRPGRVLGVRKPAEETAQTRGLDNAGVLGLQQTMFVEQDSRLDELSAVVRRQRELGLAIGAELAVHNELLDGLSADVDKTQGKLSGAKGQLKKLGS